jgi:capsular exopolysaccharide synthesis family protein
MSKFFEALEQAEQERARDEAERRRAPERPRDISPGRSGNGGPGKNAAAQDRQDRLDRPSDAAFKAAVKEKPARPRLKRDSRDSMQAPLRGLDDHLISLLDPTSPAAEQYRALCCALEQDSNLRVVAITSPGGGDGKTITAINVASTLSQADQKRVLLIDADLRHPSVAIHLGMDYLEQPGLIDAVLNPDLELHDVEIALPTFNLSIVTAGRSFDSPYEALKSPKLAALVQEARRRYDYVIVDTPPIVPVPDCRVIGRWVEGFLIVVAAHQTPRKLLEEALNIVDPAKVVGLVFNGDDVPLSRYYDYYYASGRPHNGNGGALSDRLKKAAAASRTSFPLAEKLPR